MKCRKCVKRIKSLKRIKSVISIKSEKRIKSVKRIKNRLEFIEPIIYGSTAARSRIDNYLLGMLGYPEKE